MPLAGGFCFFINCLYIATNVTHSSQFRRYHPDSQESHRSADARADTVNLARSVNQSYRLPRNVHIRVHPPRSRSREYHHMLVVKELDVAIRHCNLKNGKNT